MAVVKSLSEIECVAPGLELVPAETVRCPVLVPHALLSPNVPSPSVGLPSMFRSKVPGSFVGSQTLLI